MTAEASLYVTRHSCRSCGGGLLDEVHSAGSLPVAGIYYERSAPALDLRAPLNIVLCRSCGLLQLRETISPAIYRDYSFVGDSAGGYISYLRELARSLVEDRGLRRRRILEVGASNGILLKALKEMGENEVLGVEPSQKLCDCAGSLGVNMIRGYFTAELVSQQGLGSFDCVIIRHVLEHVDDLPAMVSALRSVLARDGLVVVEVPDLKGTMTACIFSNVFHEHLNYFSSRSLGVLMEQQGLREVAAAEVDIHGGSILSLWRPGPACAKVSAEPGEGLPGLREFFARAAGYYGALRDRVMAVLGSGRVIHGYGASHRTFVILGNAGLDSSHLPVIYDNNPLLHGKRLNGLHCLVEPKEAVRVNNPDAVLICAASYEEEISRHLTEQCRYKGELISVRHGAAGHERQV